MWFCPIRVLGVGDGVGGWGSQGICTQPADAAFHPGQPHVPMQGRASHNVLTKVLVTLRVVVAQKLWRSLPNFNYHCDPRVFGWADQEADQVPSHAQRHPSL